MYEWDLGFRLSLLGSHYISTNLIFYYQTKKSTYFVFNGTSFGSFYSKLW